MTGLSVDCAEVRLVCGLVGGTRGPFTVPIAKTLQVGQLKEKIKGMCGIAPGADIQLFSTKTADGWMKVSAAISHLEDGTTDEAIDDIICSRKIDVWLTVDEALDVPDRERPPVELIDYRSPKRAEVDVVWSAPKPAPRLEFLGNLVRLSSEFLQGSGVQVPLGRNEVVLFRRDAVDALWCEIQRSSVVKSALHIVHGSPGGGKSMASYAFAGGLFDLSKWNVLWFRDDGGLFKLVQIKDKNKTVCELKTRDADDALEAILYSSGFASAKMSIVFLDGYSQTSNKLIFDTCEFWRTRDRDRRRLVVVTSMMTAIDQFRRETDEEIDKHPRLRLTENATNSKEGSDVTLTWSEQGEPESVMNFVRFPLRSWTLAECEAAVMNDAFFWSVTEALGSNLLTVDLAIAEPHESRKLAVRRKYLIAGGNARYMFVRSFTQVVNSITDAINQVTDYMKFLQGEAGGGSHATANHLRATYPEHLGA